MNAALALAFAAGMVATVNPCGFAMLPAYLSYFMGLSEGVASPAAAMRSAFKVGGVVSFGFIVVFGLAGFAITLGFRSLTTWIPWLALGVGIAVTILGIAMMRGFELTLGLPKAKRGRRDRRVRSIFGFGISYAVASLSCTLPVFLSVVATQLASRSVAEGALIFLVYGLGMSAMLIGLTVVLALGKQTLVNRLRSSAAHINRVSGAILIGAGVFIVWFWTTEIRSGAGALGSSPAFQVVENLSQSVLNLVADNTLAVGVALGLLLAVAAFVMWRGRHGVASEPVDDERIVIGAGDR
ncbi:MAG TPA: cytochrome c biogenesis CcdA family protein [Acidimicrobiia bacterium]|jgi:cytochrome c biogenesis protein CcdA|nr:cytochrome c biogenesis CcdA family protein [Acidimicrobiia bacterium]